MSGLQRRLTRIDALAIALGSVIGVGVFRSTGLVLRGTDSFAGATALWIAVGLVCATGSFLYADLSSRVPEAGGPYAYVRVAFGRPAAFVYGWANAAIAMPVRQAAAVTVIGTLLAQWLPGTAQDLGALVLILLAVTHLLGVRVGALAQRVFTSGKLATLALVIGLAIVLWLTGHVPTTEIPAAVSFGTAVGAVWYAYLGWQDVVLLAEELREPRRDLPFVLVTTVLLVIALYTTVHVVVYLGLGGTGAAYGDLPAVATATAVLGSFGTTLLTGLALSSMLGGAAESVMVRPRIAMALGRDGLGPRRLAATTANGTPYAAILFHCAIALFLVVTGSFTELLPLLVFAQGFLGIFETASYFAVRKLRPELPTSRLHPWAPLIFIIANAALCVLAGIDDPKRAGTVLCVLTAIAGIGYVVLARKEPTS